MKILMFIFGLVTLAAFAIGFISIGDSAVREGVAGILWIAAMVALGAAAVCDRIEHARDVNRIEMEKLQRLLAEIRDQARRKEAPPVLQEFDPAKVVTQMESVRRG